MYKVVWTEFDRHGSAFTNWAARTTYRRAQQFQDRLGESARGMGRKVDHSYIHRMGFWEAVRAWGFNSD